MNAIEDNGFRRAWQTLGRELPRPRAILCLSAHWETRGPAVTAAEWPETIHDFFGFPQALFDVRYPAPGDPALADRVCGLLADFGCRSDRDRGLDHGTWGVLAPMFPAADIPVVQLSLDQTRPPADHLAMAERLAPLRDEGTLILASGNIVHNLSLFDWGDPTPQPWAKRFDIQVRKWLDAGDTTALADYSNLAADAETAVPSPEHYLPVLYAAAVRRPGDSTTFLTTEVVSTISMTSFLLQ